MALEYDGDASAKRRPADEEGEAAAEVVSELPLLHVLTLLPLKFAIRAAAHSSGWPDPSSLYVHLRPGDSMKSRLVDQASPELDRWPSSYGAVAFSEKAEGGSGGRANWRSAGEGKEKSGAAAMAHQSGGGAVSNTKGQQGEAAKVDRISALSEEARLRILGCLSLKSAIRMAAVSSGWRKLWNTYCPEASSLRLRLRTQDPLPELLASLERRGRGRRLIRFSLTIESTKMKPEGFKSCLRYAADCSAEDIHVDNRRAMVLYFRLQWTSRHLVRLSLCGIRVAKLHRCDAALSFDKLEVIHLHSTDLEDDNLPDVVKACPRLRVLDLRRCEIIRNIDFTATGTNLRSLTIAECPRLTNLSASTVSSLRSFCYSGDFLSSFELPAAASFADLYICFGRPRAPKLLDNWFNALPNLSNLTVFTICSVALRIVCSLPDAGANAELAKLSNLRSLRELHLLMFGMETVNLNDIYVFIKTCHCPQLERLFVQLPTNGRDSFNDALREVGEEPPKDGLGNLKVVKISNFKWHCNEIELVYFLFRKASSLQKLILVSPKGVHSEADIFLLEKAPANAQIILCDSDESKIRPFHSDVFVEF